MIRNILLKIINEQNCYSFEGEKKLLPIIGSNQARPDSQPIINDVLCWLGPFRPHQQSKFTGYQLSLRRRLTDTLYIDTHQPK